MGTRGSNPSSANIGKNIFQNNLPFGVDFKQYVPLIRYKIYIQSGLQPSLSHHLILYVDIGTYSLMSTPNDRFFEKHFHGGFILLSEFLPEICWPHTGVLAEKHECYVGIHDYWEYVYLFHSSKFGYNSNRTV